MKTYTKTLTHRGRTETVTAVQNENGSVRVGGSICTSDPKALHDALKTREQSYIKRVDEELETAAKMAAVLEGFGFTAQEPQP